MGIQEDSLNSRFLPEGTLLLVSFFFLSLGLSPYLLTPAEIVSLSSSSFAQSQTNDLILLKCHELLRAGSYIRGYSEEFSNPTIL